MRQSELGAMSQQFSVKDDARDLLEKYSDILIESVSEKLAARIGA